LALSRLKPTNSQFHHSVTHRLEIQQWLSRAAVNERKHALKSTILTSTGTNDIKGTSRSARVRRRWHEDGEDRASSHEEDDEEDGDYVYDIFQISDRQPDEGFQQDPAEDTPFDTLPSSNDLKDRDGGQLGIVVPVSGIHIAKDGRIDVTQCDGFTGDELMLEYDSDWSALGEDDDDDSNAENHPGKMSSNPFKYPVTFLV
jgi:hypothetical protein